MVFLQVVCEQREHFGGVLQKSFGTDAMSRQAGGVKIDFYELLVTPPDAQAELF